MEPEELRRPLAAVETWKGEATAASRLVAVLMPQDTPGEDPFVPCNILGQKPRAAVPWSAWDRSSSEPPPGYGMLPPVAPPPH
jgi:hypothetical protein